METVVENDKVTNWITVIFSCSKEIHSVALMWLSYTLFYWLLPTLIAIFGLLIARKPIHFTDLMIHGEFLIYSITLVAGSTRLIAKDLRKSGPFVNRQGFNLFSHVVIFPAIFMYGLLRYIGYTADTKTVNEPLVIWYSGILLAAAFGFSYVVFLIDAQRTASGDVEERAAQAIAHSSDQLSRDFDALQIQDAVKVRTENVPPPTDSPEALTDHDAINPTENALQAEFDALEGGE